jgi:hypothetical protein
MELVITNKKARPMQPRATKSSSFEACNAMVPLHNACVFYYWNCCHAAAAGVVET